MSITGIGPDLAGKAAGGRRLIAVVYADMVGYSRLIGLDDAGTLRRLRTLRRALIDPSIREHGGRVVQTGGDSLLIAFDSIDGAVRCAVKVQQQVPVYDGDQPPDRRIRFRVGINIGDVIPDGTNLHGDGTNIAARLEAASPVGGICVSRAVRDHVHGRLDLAFESVGELTLKNVARSIEAFVLRLDPAAETLPQPEPPASRTPLAPVRRPSTRALIAGGGILVAILACSGWWMQRDRISAPVAPAIAPMAARPVPYSPEDRRMSVIVLPFENSSGDPAQDGVAAGITRDLTNRLAQTGYDALIPATTSALYLGKAVDLQKIGRDQNVHFALIGDARRQDGRLIVSATLYETTNNRAIWAQRFDNPDRGGDWNSVVQHISDRMVQTAIDAEVARAQQEHPNSLDKRDLYLASRATSLSSEAKPNLLTRIALIDRALAEDPNFVRALQRKALLYANLVDQGFSSNRDADLTTALKAANRALQLAPNDAVSLERKAFVLQMQGNMAEATALIRKVIELDPEGWWYQVLGRLQMTQGQYKEALESFTTAKQLVAETSPIVDQGLAYALLANDRLPEAIAQARLAMGEWAGDARQAELSWLVLIVAESGNGQTAQARADLEKFLATPRTYRSIVEVQKNPLLAGNAKLIEGLRHAGMPEE